MEIRNCKRCGRLYTYTGIDLCPVCYRQDEEDFMKVRDYLDTHPSATMLEISQNTQVST
ncbi:MAG TPA: MerR family transcriptional regulator, partial [Thermoanaerobacter sp.]|nr:MerR family transcriptional regulator [Thermoanaerobacter sp.]